jgi:hypothetical protein
LRHFYSKSWLARKAKASHKRLGRPAVTTRRTCFAFLPATQESVADEVFTGCQSHTLVCRAILICSKGFKRSLVLHASDQIEIVTCPTIENLGLLDATFQSQLIYPSGNYSTWQLRHILQAEKADAICKKNVL